MVIVIFMLRLVEFCIYLLQINRPIPYFCFCFIWQADKASLNSIGIFKISNISGKNRELVPSTANGSDMDSDSSDSDEDDVVKDGGSAAPVFQAMLRLREF